MEDDPVIAQKLAAYRQQLIRERQEEVRKETERKERQFAAQELRRTQKQHLYEIKELLKSRYGLDTLYCIKEYVYIGTYSSDMGGSGYDYSKTPTETRYHFLPLKCWFGTKLETFGEYSDTKSEYEISEDFDELPLTYDMRMIFSLVSGHQDFHKNIVEMMKAARHFNEVQKLKNLLLALMKTPPYPEFEAEFSICLVETNTFFLFDKEQLENFPCKTKELSDQLEELKAAASEFYDLKSHL